MFFSIWDLLVRVLVWLTLRATAGWSDVCIYNFYFCLFSFNKTQSSNFHWFRELSVLCDRTLQLIMCAVTAWFSLSLKSVTLNSLYVDTKPSTVAF